MCPQLHPYAVEPILALAAVDYVADKISDVPPATHLFLNMVWTYGRRPPLVPTETYDFDEVLALCWGEALYEPGTAYLLEQMRQRGKPETPMQWFHDAVYLASLFAFRLMWSAEEEALPQELRSGATSDIAELTDLPDEFIEACGQALEDVEGFRVLFEEARARFEADLRDPNAPLWPPFGGMARSWTEEWFE